MMSSSLADSANDAEAASGGRMEEEEEEEEDWRPPCSLLSPFSFASLYPFPCPCPFPRTFECFVLLRPRLHVLDARALLPCFMLRGTYKQDTNEDILGVVNQVRKGLDKDEDLNKRIILVTLRWIPGGNTRIKF